MDKKQPGPNIDHQVLKTLYLGSTQCLAFDDSAVCLHAAYAAPIHIGTRNTYTQKDHFSDRAFEADQLDKPRDLSDLEPQKNTPAPEPPLDPHALYWSRKDFVRQPIRY